MNRNVEIKARAADFSGQMRHAAELADEGPMVIRQEDTFFHCARGRLKLRQFSEKRGELIYYDRADTRGPKQCSYLIIKTEDADTLKAALSRAYGVLGVVRKVRALYRVGQTRLHFDEVEGLGRFIEVEVVLGPEQTLLEGEGIARGLMAKLGIGDGDLIEGAYIDFLVDKPG